MIMIHNKYVCTIYQGDPRTDKGVRCLEGSGQGNGAVQRVLNGNGVENNKVRACVNVQNRFSRSSALSISDSLAVHPCACRRQVVFATWIATIVLHSHCFPCRARTVCLHLESLYMNSR
jgi:hypothetical protein